ncbi:sarcosine oxidase subunit alpha family protein [Acuticoccus sediminis]|uniref:sarcosine oxidase subunit alpha family protein n=1 Tax=Acuticoccus sediminis TaxID=2184697 RepID=UPI001CFEB716|nr:sarcosine oxidase subunit alpha family protein [Acuticoccus sediminis]
MTDATLSGTSFETASYDHVAPAPFRVAGRGRINDVRAVRFTFDGREIVAAEGDTVASALLAHGIHLVGRSFKYHRPRGVVTAGSEEPNALINVSRGPGRAEPNTRATMQEAVPGLKVESQNRWPSLAFDVGAVNDRLSRVLGAGFYYKTFKWPRSFWDSVYEPVIRAAAGLGRAPAGDDPDHYASRYAYCDVLVVGAGPAGIAAALQAALAGGRVILADEGSEPGGSLLSTPGARIDGAPAWAFLRQSLATLAEAGVRILPRTTAIAYDHENMVGLVERVTDHLAVRPEGAPRERLWRVRATRVVLAQGAIEKPLVFDGNDRPGVMLAGAAQTYLNRYGVAVGRRVAIATSHDSAWYAAFDLADAGVEIAVIADTRAEVAEDLRDAASGRGIRIALSSVPVATQGARRVKAVWIAERRGSRVGEANIVRCDAVLMSSGWTPAVSLFSHTKGKLAWDAASGRFLPDTSPEACLVAGAGKGVWGLAEALSSGADAGASATGTDAAPARFAVTHDHAGTGAPEGALPSDHYARKAFVDFQNDVTAKDIRLAVKEGMRSIEHIKRYTTTGMATDQGKLSNINGLMIAAEALGRTPPEVGLTTFRPPYTPTTFGALAGPRRGATFEVERKTPIDPWAAAHGAVFEAVSLWRRARYFPEGVETMDEAVARECRKTRQTAGIFDASTLGKIEVVGPDAAEFLNRMYTNPMLKLGVGKCRYALMLGDDGFIRDDGIIARIAEDRFHVTTTTGGAPRVLATMEDYLQTEWPDLRVWLTSTTEEWATIAVNGPKAREIIAPYVTGLDISAEAFPHMSVAACTFAGVPCRLFRVSFTGELGFEVNVGAAHALEVWERIVGSGRAHGACVYGTETMHVLRAEKGYIIVGQETDGTVTPHDAGLSWAIGKTKADFVGMRALTRPDMLKDDRKQLVGLLTEDPDVVLEEGAQIVADPAEPLPMTMLGHVTSSYRSATLGRSIALAVVSGGAARTGETLYVPMPGGTIAATVTGTVFFDAEGARLNG